MEIRRFHSQVRPFSQYVESPLLSDECHALLRDDFPLTYLLQALLSRGAVFKDHILTSAEKRDKFVHLISEEYFKDTLV